MNRISKTASMLIILSAGTGLGDPAGLTGPAAGFQPRPWASPPSDNLSSQPRPHLPILPISRLQESLSHCEVTNSKNADLPATAQSFISVTSMLKEGLLVCHHKNIFFCLSL